MANTNTATSGLNTAGAKAVLTLAHVAGMVDMVALPLWIGALMQHHAFGPPRAQSRARLNERVRK